MTKKLRATDCLVVVFSSLIVGCASNLPELPLDAPYVPAPSPEISTIAAPSAAPISTPARTLNSEVIFEEAKIDSARDVYQPAVIDSGSDFIEEIKVSSTGNDNPLVFIANDLVNALSFIGGMNPNRTTISSPVSASEFDNMVKNSMLGQGYRFTNQRVRGSQQLTTSFLEVSKNAELSELTAIMALNSVLIKRSYLIRNDIVEPRTSYVIRGIDPRLVNSSNQISVL